MKYEQAKALGEQLLKDAGDDVALKLTAWEAIRSIALLYHEINANVYCDDPMSEYAPSECLESHMKTWEGLLRNTEAGLQMAQNEYDEAMREPTPEEMELYINEMYAEMEVHEL